MTIKEQFSGFQRSTKRLNVTRKQQIGGGRSPLTDLGNKLGIEIFKIMDYAGKEVLLYFPLVLDAEGNYLRNENGERVKFYEQVVIRQLQHLGTGNYAGTIRDTTGLGDLELPGISGEFSFGEYLGKVSQYNNALFAVEAASKFKVAADSPNIPEEDRKAMWRGVFSKNPIGRPQSNYWFPVVVIEFEGSIDKGDVKYTVIDKVDENGNPIVNEKGQQVKTVKSKLCWFKASQQAYDKKFADPFTSISRSEELDDDGNVIVEEEGSDFSQYFARLNLTNTKDTKGVEIKDNNKLAMHLGKEYTVTILSKEQSKFKKLYKSLTPLFAEWDKLANEYYNEVALAQTVKECELLTDVEVQEKLDTLLKNIDAETAALEATAQAILAGQDTPTLGGADAVLSGAGAIQQLGAGQQQQVTQEQDVLDATDNLQWSLTQE